jgi:hypothetical protein
MIPIVLLFLFLAATAFADAHLALDSGSCLQCHDDTVSVEEMASSVHGQNSCNSCHVEVTDLDEHMAGEIEIQQVKCVRCHKKEAAEHFASIHMLNDVGCADCHSQIHSATYWQNDKRKVVETCAQCHDVEENYLNSVHGRAVMSGNGDSAACNDCHNLHEIKALGDPNSFENRDFHTKVCLTCHADEEMMARNSVFNVAVGTYMESYHGKNYHLGFPEKVAGCADCHSSHSVLPKSDPNSSVNDSNLVATCSQCHEGATSLFTRYYSHGEHSDRDNYPILYWTFLGMTSLLVGTFAVFWIHTLLWMFRGFVENRERPLLCAAFGRSGRTE